MANIKTTTWNKYGLVEAENLAYKEINSKLRVLENKASAMLRSCNSKGSHVVYAVKYYDRGCTPFTVHFYDEPLLMTDIDFDSKVASLKDARVYALHK